MGATCSVSLGLLVLLGKRQRAEGGGKFAARKRRALVCGVARYVDQEARRMRRDRDELAAACAPAQRHVRSGRTPLLRRESLQAIRLLHESLTSYTSGRAQRWWEAFFIPADVLHSCGRFRTCSIREVASPLLHRLLRSCKRTAPCRSVQRCSVAAPRTRAPSAKAEVAPLRRQHAQRTIDHARHGGVDVMGNLDEGTLERPRGA